MSNKVLKDLANISKNVKVIDKNNNLNNLTPGTKWKIEAEGKVKDMPKNTIDVLTKSIENLTKTVNDLSKTVTDGFAKVNSRLDTLEKDVNVLKSFHKDDIKKLKSQKEK